jgi:hypothetical protein
MNQPNYVSKLEMNLQNNVSKYNLIMRRSLSSLRIKHTNYRIKSIFKRRGWKKIIKL